MQLKPKMEGYKIAVQPVTRAAGTPLAPQVPASWGRKRENRYSKHLIHLTAIPREDSIPILFPCKPKENKTKPLNCSLKKNIFKCIMRHNFSRLSFSETPQGPALWITSDYTGHLQTHQNWPGTAAEAEGGQETQKNGLFCLCRSLRTSECLETQSRALFTQRLHLKPEVQIQL